MSRRHVALLALVALLAGLIPEFLGLAPESLVGDARSDWLPLFGTVGRTVTIYLLGAQVFGFLFVPFAAALVGHRVQPAVEIEAEPRLVILLFLVVGVVFVTLGTGLAVLVIVTELGYYPRSLTTPLGTIGRGIERGATFGFVAFAGAALATFDR